MKLRTITKLAALSQLLMLGCHFANTLRSLIQLANDHTSWKYNWLYFLTMPFYVFGTICLLIFFVTLTDKQKDS